MTIHSNQSPNPPSNYLVFAILSTVFCCQPLGIVSIIYAAMVNSRWASGDQEGAIRASKSAKLWAWVAFASGIVIGLGLMFLSILGIVLGISLGAFEF